MMDLLVFLCAQYHLNPSSHTIDLLSAEENLIKYKPNTPIGMLEVEKVILKPKSLDKKKPTPIIPEVRILSQILMFIRLRQSVDFFLSQYLWFIINEIKLDFWSGFLEYGYHVSQNYFVICWLSILGSTRIGGTI